MMNPAHSASKLTFEESQYLLCPDFGAIYRKLKYPKIEDRDAAVKAATKEQKAACSIPTPKNRQRVARTLPKNVSAYELENGILYYRSPMYGSVTCVPHGIASPELQNRPNGTEYQLSKKHNSSDDNDAVHTTDTETHLLTHREFIIREMHNTPMAAHRGINQTVAQLTSAFVG